MDFRTRSRQPWVTSSSTLVAVMSQMLVRHESVRSGIAQVKVRNIYTNFRFVFGIHGEVVSLDVVTVSS